MSKIAAPTATRLRDLATGRTDLMKMDPNIITIEKGHNPRDYRLPENRAHLDSLKISIAAVGVRQPLMCRFDGGQAILVDGESRLTAVLELLKEGNTDIKTVPVMQVIANNEADRIAIAVGANTGKPLSEWELGGAFKRLIGFGWEPVDIAGQFGMTEQKVNKCVELADMPQDVKQLLSERAVTPALAITTIRKRGTRAGTEDLKAAATAAKSAGKKTAKAHKAPSKREVSTAEWEKVGRALYKSAEEEWLESQKPGVDKADWINVRYGLFKKLAALVEGTK